MCQNFANSSQIPIQFGKRAQNLKKIAKNSQFFLQIMQKHAGHINLGEKRRAKTAEERSVEQKRQNQSHHHRQWGFFHITCSPGTEKLFS